MSTTRKYQYKYSAYASKADAKDTTKDKEMSWLKEQRIMFGTPGYKVKSEIK